MRWNGSLVESRSSTCSWHLWGPGISGRFLTFLKSMVISKNPGPRSFGPVRWSRRNGSCAGTCFTHIFNFVITPIFRNEWSQKTAAASSPDLTGAAVSCRVTELIHEVSLSLRPGVPSKTWNGDHLADGPEAVPLPPTKPSREAHVAVRLPSALLLHVRRLRSHRILIVSKMRLWQYRRARRFEMARIADYS